MRGIGRMEGFELGAKLSLGITLKNPDTATAFSNVEVLIDYSKIMPESEFSELLKALK